MLTIHNQEQLASWLWDRAGIEGRDVPTFCIGKLIDKQLVAVIGYNYHFEDTRSIYAHLAGDTDKNWLTRDFLYMMFAFPFLHLETEVIFAATLPTNKKIHQFLCKTNFALLKATPDWLLWALNRVRCNHLHYKGVIKWAE